MAGFGMLFWIGFGERRRGIRRLNAQTTGAGGRLCLGGTDLL